MSKINEIILPDFLSEKKETTVGEKPKKQKAKTITDTIERLPRTNREVVCAYCGELKIINPDQYQLLFDIHGSEERIAEEFMCKPCEVKMKKNPIEFWVKNGESLQNLSKNLKTAFDLYKNSAKTQADAIALQDMSVAFLKECKVTKGFEFITQDNLPVALVIHDFPFVGTVALRVYERRDNRIKIIG